MALRSCLRRLIGRGGFISNQLELEVKSSSSSSYYGATNVVYFNSSSSSCFNSFSFYRWIHSSGNHINNRIEEEQVGGSGARKWRYPEDDLLIGIKIGEVVDLSQLLFTETRDYLIKCNDGRQVSFSRLVGKRVIILFDKGKLLKKEAEFLETLKDQYNHTKGTDDEFEVIHITALSTTTGHVADLPWFVQPRGRDDNIFRLFDFYVRLIAFDRNGRLVRKAIYPTFEDTNFPFYAGGLEKEALSQAVNLFGWDRYRNGFPGMMIHSYRKEE